MLQYRDLKHSGELLQSLWGALPSPLFARWASIFLSFSVWTCMLSLAASQAFLALAGVCYAIHLLRDKPGIRFPPVKLPLLVFCFLTVLSVISATRPSPGWLAVRKLVLFLILLFATNLVVRRRHLEAILRVLFVESGVVALVGMAQFISRYYATLASSPHRLYALMTSRERIQGFMGHWMNFGGQQMLVSAALLVFLVLGTPRKKIWWLMLWVVIAISIVLSLTRGVWVGCFVAALYALACWKPRWLVVIPILMVIAYFASPYLVRERLKVTLHPASDPALSIRFEMWHVGLNMMRTHPWLGVGPDDVERDYTLYLPVGQAPIRGYHSHLHNNFLQLGAERGLPGLAAWIWFMGTLGWHMFRISRRVDEQQWIARAGMAAWLAFVTEGCFEFNFGTSPVLMLFLFLAATPFILERLESCRPHSEESGFL